MCSSLARASPALLGIVIQTRQKSKKVYFASLVIVSQKRKEVEVISERQRLPVSVGECR